MHPNTPDNTLGGWGSCMLVYHYTCVPGTLICLEQCGLMVPIHLAWSTSYYSILICTVVMCDFDSWLGSVVEHHATTSLQAINSPGAAAAVGHTDQQGSESSSPNSERSSADMSESKSTYLTAHDRGSVQSSADFYSAGEGQQG